MSDLNVSKKKIAKDSIKVALTLIFVKIIAIFKQAAIAATFGAGAEMDAYLVANDFLSEIGSIIFASLSVSFLNFYLINAVKSKEDKEKFAGNVLSVFIPIAIAIAVIAAIISRPMAFVLAPGFSESGQALVSRCVIILAVTLVNSCISTLFTGILDAEKDFVPGKLASFFQGVFIIITTLTLSDLMGIDSLLVGFIAYNFFNNFFLFLRSRRYIRIKLHRPRYTDEVKTIIKQSVPLFISNSASQVNVMIDKAICSGLDVGTVSALSYGSFIVSSVGTIFIGGFCSIFYSNFSSCAAEENYEKMHKLYKRSLYMFLFLLIPVIIYICYNSSDVVRLLYQRGAFDEVAAGRTSLVTFAYALGFIFGAFREVSAFFCYANQNTKSPMINTLIIVGVNITASLILVGPLGGFGVALGTTIGQFVGMILMVKTAVKYLNSFREIIDIRGIFTALLAGATGFIAIFALGFVMGDVHFIARLLINFGVLLGAYVAILALLRCPYLKEVIKMIRRKSS